MGEIPSGHFSSASEDCKELESPNPPVYFQLAKCGFSEEGKLERVSSSRPLPGEDKNIKQCGAYRPLGLRDSYY